MSRKSDIWFFDIIKPVAATLIVFHHYQQVFKCVFPGINFYDGFFIANDINKFTLQECS